MHDQDPRECNYFQAYGDEGRPGDCKHMATLQLESQPRVIVCRSHAERIADRFPLLGDVATRFLAWAEVVS